MLNKGMSLNLGSLHKGHLNVTYKGVPALKCPFDYVMYQMLINDLKPDLIIEIGTYMGGATYYYAELLDLLGKGEVHTIDINDKSPDVVKNHPRVKTFSEGWDKYPLELISQYEKVLIIEDSSHTYENTLAVMKHFYPYVSKGSYFIIEDGVVTALVHAGVYPYETYNGGPQRAIEEFLIEYPNLFEIDRYYCDMFGTNATWNPNGYLKKIN